MMKNPGKTIPRPTEAELELLRILWEKEPATVRDIYDSLNLERPSGYTTVLKMLQIMTVKGLVMRDESSRAHLYRTTISQDAMQSKILKDLSIRLFSGSAAQLALHALAMEPATAGELNEIRALIEHNRLNQAPLNQAPLTRTERLTETHRKDRP
ncbi:MAG: BlaI/MecI/CopY family transcriptional regulator [Terracidiphilus sp.]